MEKIQKIQVFAVYEFSIWGVDNILKNMRSVWKTKVIHMFQHIINVLC